MTTIKTIAFGSVYTVTVDPTLDPAGTYGEGSIIVFQNPPAADLVFIVGAGGILLQIDPALLVSLTSGVSGTLPILHGGTGQTTASAALNALLPAQTGLGGDVLSTNGTVAAWTSPVPSPSLGYGFFYHMVTGGDATIAIDASVPFNTAGATAGGITSSSATEILLPAIGVYDVSWQVSVNEAGQLMLNLNTSGTYTLQLQTLAGRATGTNQISNRVIVTTTAVNSLIKIQNHSSPAALTMTPLPGGTSAGTTSLTVVRLA